MSEPGVERIPRDVGDAAGCGGGASGWDVVDNSSHHGESVGVVAWLDPLRESPLGFGCFVGLGFRRHLKTVAVRGTAGNLKMPDVHILDSAMDAQPVDIAGYFLCRGEVSTLFTQQVSGFFIA